jgi:hypothetical protein
MSISTQCELCGASAGKRLPYALVQVMLNGEAGPVGSVSLCQGCMSRPVSEVVAAVEMSDAIKHTRLVEDRRRRGLDT